MTRWRLLCLALIVLVPFVAMLAAGAYYVFFLSGWGAWFSWALLICLVVSAVLAYRWRRHIRRLAVPEFDVPLHWTDRDRQAWQIVEARARAGGQLSAEKLGTVSFYLEAAQELALELARFYHPRAQDPIGSLTIPEILAVVELAAHDLAEMVDQYLPGGHLLTVGQWRQAKTAADVYRTASNISWLISSIFNPIGTGLRYLASEIGVGRPLQMLQQNLILWFYTAYIHRMGNYLIELNSGRLRVGATRYRQLKEAGDTSRSRVRADGEKPSVEPAADARQVTVTVLGQVKAGKSSFINGLLGEHRARTAVVPATAEITHYELQTEGVPGRIVLLDTVGYGHAGPKPDQLKATLEAAKQSDLLVLVLHATNPAREADLELLRALRDWRASQPGLKAPPILGVLTHIDLLSPMMEWNPPYDWQKPQRLKEHQIDQAVAAARAQLGDGLAGIVPACTASGKVYGIDEWFLPALAELLDEAHAVAFLRCLKAETDTGKVRKVFQQLLAAGRGAVKVLWQANAPR
jgi:predicted GTPase